MGWSGEPTIPVARSPVGLTFEICTVAGRAVGRVDLLPRCDESRVRGISRKGCLGGGFTDRQIDNRSNDPDCENADE